MGKSMERKTREFAEAAGDVKFYTGALCRRGHDSPRYVSTGQCCKCMELRSVSARKKAGLIRNNRAAGAFIYPLHPEDFIKAHAFCMALDLERGRAPRPFIPPAVPLTAEEIKKL